MRRDYLLLPGIAAMHLALSGLLMLLGGGASLAAIETGGELSSLSRGAGVAAEILLHPLFIPASEWLPKSSGVVGWAVLILNSFLWAAACYALVRWHRVHRRRT